MATNARKLAEYMESYRMAPGATETARYKDALVGPDMLAGPAQVYDYVRSKISPRTPRTEEEMSELTREAARALSAREAQIERDVERASAAARAKFQGYAKGGKVSSASSRADGCAQRGKTKGRIL